MASNAQLQSFSNLVAQEVKWFRAQRFETVLLLHHNDCDGLSSATILVSLFERLGISVRRICLEKPFPLVLARVFADFATERNGLCVLADFGSGMLSQIHALANNAFPVFILDHHTIEGGVYRGIRLINPLLFGIPGLPDCSASTVAALFALGFGDDFADLCSLGVLGALGDRGIDERGELLGLNRKPLEVASRSGSVTSASPYIFAAWSNLSGEVLARHVDALGGFGYFQGGPDIAVKGLREQFDASFQACAQRFQDDFNTAMQSCLREGFISRGSCVDSFSLGAQFKRFGIKTVGLMCERLLDQNIASPDRYLAGFQAVPDEIPGLGIIALQQVKVSMRLGAELRKLVEAGERPGLHEVLPQATQKLGGFVDACHPHAAATTIPPGTEPELLRLLENSLSSD